MVGHHRFEQQATRRRTASARRTSRWPGLRYGIEAALVAALALLVAALVSQEPSSDARDLDLPAVLLIVAACAPVAFRRVAPTAAASAALVIAVGGSIANFPMPATVVVALTLVGHATSQAEVRRTGTFGVLSGTLVAVLAASQSDVAPGLAAIGGFAVGIFPALVGERLRAERARTADAQELTRRAEKLHDREVQRAVDEERLRIARDVHDITGHHLSAIALRAAGAGQATRDPDARTALDQIHALTTEALGQTERVLGTLRDGAPAALAPPPRLAHVEGLLEPARASGAAVDLEIAGAAHPLDDTVEASAYRVIQEALTNVVRHADATVVRVRMEYEVDRLTVTVQDDGRGRASRAGGGITGMRERVASVGGTLAAGPGESGGWSVRAVLPLKERA